MHASVIIYMWELYCMAGYKRSRSEPSMCISSLSTVVLNMVRNCTVLGKFCA